MAIVCAHKKYPGECGLCAYKIGVRDTEAKYARLAEAAKWAIDDRQADAGDHDYTTCSGGEAENASRGCGWCRFVAALREIEGEK